MYVPLEFENSPCENVTLADPAAFMDALRTSDFIGHVGIRGYALDEGFFNVTLLIDGKLTTVNLSEWVQCGSGRITAFALYDSEHVQLDNGLVEVTHYVGELVKGEPVIRYKVSTKCDPKVIEEYSVEIFGITARGQLKPSS